MMFEFVFFVVILWCLVGRFKIFYILSFVKDDDDEEFCKVVEEVSVLRF